MSMSVFQIGLLTAGLVFLIGGAVLAAIASHIAAAGRAARAEADIRLAASQELAVEVKRLAEKVEQSLAARDAAIENAFLRHNDACMASMQSSLAAHTAGGCSHDSAAGARLSGGHHDDDDDDHKKHHAAMSGAHGHDDDDDGRGKHHAANDEHARPSLLARLFRRYP
jgi:recombinational DNA repair ATPase RecF